MGARKNWSGEQIIGILKQVEAGRTVVEVCREHGVGESTYYKWKASMVVWKSTRRDGLKASKTKTRASSA
jgi:putative transposase